MSGLPEHLANLEGQDRAKLYLLTLSLSVAVPMWIERLRGYTDEDRDARARVCSQAIAEKGDVVLYRSKKKGETADAFNRLAEGIACLAFAPGGVHALGLHFEANRS